MKIEREIKHNGAVGTTRIAPPIKDYFPRETDGHRVIVYLTPEESAALEGRSARVTIEPAATLRERQVEAAREEIHRANESAIGIGLDTLAERIVDAVLAVKS